MFEPTDSEQQIIGAFLAPYFGKDFRPMALQAEEKVLIEAIINLVDKDFSSSKYILGLALDFTLLAQSLSLIDPDAKKFRPTLTGDAFFQRYKRIERQGTTTANTLSVIFGKKRVGIRKIEEQVGNLFHKLNRSGYPSAYVYNTGQWHKNPELMLSAFKLSDAGRYSVTKRLIEHGLTNLAINTFFGREIARPRLFEAIINDYDRTARKTENGGLVFQAIAYGYVKADRPHLDLIVDKVRTGSSRQKRFGDVDGYYGLDLELSVEVKDFRITAENIDQALGESIINVAGNNINGISFALGFDATPKQKLESANISAMSQADVLWIVKTWDWHKQDRALQGVLHYLSHVEQNPTATTRLLEFLKEIDEAHSSLSYLIPSPFVTPLDGGQQGLNLEAEE